MTKQDFILLPFDQQESYINSGGVVSADVDVSPAVSQVDESLFNSNAPVIVSEARQPDVTFREDIDGVLISDPVDLLMLVDPEIQRGFDNGGVDLMPWQVQIMLDFANAKHSQDNPFQAAVRACNGSGKDKYVIASCAVWLCMRYKNTLCPITSSSGFQLDNQTCKHTKRLCEAVNRWAGVELWDCKYRNYTMRFDGKDNQFNSQILCFATDEAGKAEGFHPTEKGKRMAIFCSEDKTIPDEINDSLNKCTGYTHRVHASTPGKSYGHFHDYCKMAVSRKAIKSVTEVGPTDWIEYHVKGEDCPYRGINAREMAAKNIPGGENSDAFRSQEDAEFGNGDGEMTVIPYTYVWQACRNTWKTPWYPEDFNTAGVDLSDGGDETCLAVRNGNKLIKLDPFKISNQGERVRYLAEKFKEFDLDHPRARINGDSVGAGKPDLDRLKEMGWVNIRYVDSRAAAYEPTVYKNRNAELWFTMLRLFEKRRIILFLDQILEKQLGSRHYKLMDGKIHQMLSKVEERRLGHPSPDRADGVNLAFWGYRFPVGDEEVTEEDKPFKPEEPEQEDTKGIFSIRVWAKGQRHTVQSRVNDRVSDLNDIRSELFEANRRRRLLHK